MRHVIIGNGMAGISAARTIRSIDPGADISILTDEGSPFYSRPGLMYYMMGLLKEWDLRIARDHFYESLNARMLYDRALRIRPDENLVELRSGSTLPFDRLLLATGGRSRTIDVPGSDLSGIHYMYSLTDCKRIMADTRAGMKAVVIGGGLLGAELAEVWRHAGLSVTFLVLEDWYFPRGLNEPLGRIVEAEIRGRGCELLLPEEVAEFRGAGGRVSKVVTRSGREFGADIVGVTIGVVPNSELATASEIGVGRGITVDQTLRTSRRDVYAAGDCAEIRPTPDARPIIEQLWYSADRQGRAAARNMCGDTRPYETGIFYNSAKFFGLDYVSIGAGRYPDDEQAEETVLTRNGRAARRFIFRGDVVTGVTSIGHNDNPQTVMDILRNGASVNQAKAGLGVSR